MVLGAPRRRGLVAALPALPPLARTHQDAPPPVFPSDVELVMGDAVLVDAQGRPGPGLTGEDLVVLEAGVPQDLVAFEGIAPVETRAPSGTSASTAPPPPERVATNLGRRAEGARFLVVADDIH